MAASLTKAGIPAQAVAQQVARPARVAAFTGLKSNNNSFWGKSNDASFSKKVSARMATVQVGASWLMQRILPRQLLFSAFNFALFT